MTTPAPPPEDEAAAEMETVPPEPADEGAMLTIILAAIAAYLAGKQVVKGPWRATAMALGLTKLTGGALSQLATRTLTARTKDLPRGARAELLAQQPAAAAAGVAAGIEHLVRTIYGVQDRMMADATPAPDASTRPGDARGRGAEAAPGGTTTARRAPALTPGNTPRELPAAPGTAELTARDVISPERLRNTARDLADTVILTALTTAATLAQNWNKTWVTRNDDRVRSSHRELAGTTIGVLDTFTTPGGPIRFPHDPKAPASEVMNCFPADTLVEGAVTAAMRRTYSGPMVEVSTADGRKLTGTPNHPVLTSAGWAALSDLLQGDELICYRGEVHPTAVRENVDNRPAQIGEVFDALLVAGQCVRAASGRVNFHGETPEDNVDVVSVDGQLRNDHLGQTSADQFISQLALPAADPRALRLQRDRSSLQSQGRVSAAPPSLVGARSQGLPLRAGGGSHADEHGCPAAAGLDVTIEEDATDSAALDSQLVAERVLGLPGEVLLDQVVSIKLIPAWTGHVYNLSTSTGAYSGNGIIVHNCRCSLLFTYRKASRAATPQVAAAAPPH